MVALALIGVDVVLRLLMIEPTTKPHGKSVESETEPLLRNESPIDYQTRSLDQSHPDIEGSLHPNTPSRIPPIVRLAMSGQLLVLLIASIVDAAIWTTFETVLSSFLVLLNEAQFYLDRPSICDPKLQMGVFRDRHVFLGLDAA